MLRYGRISENHDLKPWCKHGFDIVNKSEKKEKLLNLYVVCLFPIIRVAAPEYFPPTPTPLGGWEDKKLVKAVVLVLVGTGLRLRWWLKITSPAGWRIERRGRARNIQNKRIYSMELTREQWGWLLLSATQNALIHFVHNKVPYCSSENPSVYPISHISGTAVCSLGWEDSLM